MKLELSIFLIEINDHERHERLWKSSGSQITVLENLNRPFSRRRHLKFETRLRGHNKRGCISVSIFLRTDAKFYILLSDT